MSGLLSIGDLVEPGPYHFHSRFNRACNFERNGRLISVVDEDIGPGPINIVLRSPAPEIRPEAAVIHPPPERGVNDPRIAEFLGINELSRANQFPPLEIGPNVVTFANYRFLFTTQHRYHSALDVQPGIPPRFHCNLEAFGELLKKTSPPKSLAFLLDDTRLKNFRSGFEQAFADRICQGAQQVFHGHLLEGIRSLKGCGLGLTPSGDDFIAGLLIGLNLLQKLRGQAFQRTADAVFGAAEGDNIFSNTFLDLARRGLLFGRMKDLLLVLMTGNEASVRKATGKLFAIGASSGADLATGLFLTVHEQSRPV